MQKLSKLVDELIQEGQELIRNATPGGEVRDGFKLKLWASKLVLLRTVGGELVRPWRASLSHNGVVILASRVEEPLAALMIVRNAMDGGLLVTFKDLVVAEVFADLYEQGTYLLSASYHVAAGVLFRAVLEERLRALCQLHGCLPAKSRPTIEDFNQALYKAQVDGFDKSTMLHVTAMAATGNDAAHASPTLTAESVKALGDQLLPFLSKFARAT